MKKIIALLDKEYPPNHSFVDGMLASELAKEKDIRVELLVSGSSIDKVCRYNKAICIPLLYSRKGVYRFINFFKAIILLNNIFKKNKKNEIILFVRNEPIYLLACAFIKKKNFKLIFQSSFPHEEVANSFFKRLLARWFYKIAGRRVDSLLAVSPKGLERLKKLIPYAKKNNFIPLLSDENIKVNDFELKDQKKRIKVIYVGTHSKERKLEIVLKAITKAIDKGLSAEFKFIGGEAEDIKRLSNVDGVDQLKKKGIIKFFKKIPRENLWSEFVNVDIGLSLIPPDKHYKEASPTKLSEYMRAGIAVLASNGIDLQEEFIKQSGGGILCDWNEDVISDSLINISINRVELNIMKKKGYKYSIMNLNYRNYINSFRHLM